MSHSNGMIFEPVDTDDISIVLGVPSDDVGFLCSNEHNAINIYSRFKPTIVTENPVIQLTPENVAHVRFSLVLTESNSIDGLYRDVVTNGEAPIKYYIPGYHRLTDFHRYKHDCKLPISVLGYREIQKGIATQGKDYKTQIIPSTAGATEYQIGYEELYEHINEGTSQIDVLHHGVLLINAAGDKYWCTDFVNWKQLPIRNWTGNITVFQFITNVQKNTDNGDVHEPDYFDWFAAVTVNAANPNPFTWKVTNEFPDGSLEYQVSGTIPAYDNGDGTYRLEYTVVFSAKGDAYRGGSARNVYVQLMNGTNQLEYRDIVSGVDIAKGEEKRWEGTFNTVIEASNLMKLRMIISANNEDKYTARPIIHE